MFNVLSLLILLFVSLVIGYCGAKEKGFHKLGAFFGIVDDKKEDKKEVC